MTSKVKTVLVLDTTKSGIDGYIIGVFEDSKQGLQKAKSHMRRAILQAVDEELDGEIGYIVIKRSTMNMVLEDMTEVFNGDQYTEEDEEVKVLVQKAIEAEEKKERKRRRMEEAEQDSS